MEGVREKRMKQQGFCFESNWKRGKDGENRMCMHVCGIDAAKGI